MCWPQSQTALLWSAESQPYHFICYLNWEGSDLHMGQGANTQRAEGWGEGWYQASSLQHTCGKDRR